MKDLLTLKQTNLQISCFCDFHKDVLLLFVSAKQETRFWEKQSRRWKIGKQDVGDGQKKAGCGRWGVRCCRPLPNTLADHTVLCSWNMQSFTPYRMPEWNRKKLFIWFEPSPASPTLCTRLTHECQQSCTRLAHAIKLIPMTPKLFFSATTSHIWVIKSSFWSEGCNLLAP